MKPSREDQAAPAGGPWQDCFEAAVQLALRAGQVSAAALLPSSPAATLLPRPGRVSGGGRSACLTPLGLRRVREVGAQGPLWGLGKPVPGPRAAAGSPTAAGAGFGLLEQGAGLARPGRVWWASGGRGLRLEAVKEVFVFVSCADLPFTCSTSGAGAGNASFFRGGGSHPKHVSFCG